VRTKYGKHLRPRSRPLEMAAIGLEAEFSVVADGRASRPEAVFGTPRAFMRGRPMHREGTSYHLPTGGAVYFDTGVIEVATPVIEIERGAAARAGRSLWEGIHHVRDELDHWERRTGRDVRLVGFSAHYNVSFDLPDGAPGGSRTVERLAWMLAHLLPVPVMLLATNPRSTAVGIRPRGDRIELTVDFTPSPALTVATATLVTGIVREVMRWPRYDLAALRANGIPLIGGFHPLPHTSRKGWLARRDAYPLDPFTTPPDAPVWPLAGGGTLSLREIAGRIVRRFWRPIRRISDPFTFRLIGSIMAGRAPSLMDMPDRPEAYEDVGRLCTWDDLFPERALSRSRYERVLIRAISGRRLRVNGHWHTPVGMRGWSEVVFRRDDGARSVVPVDALLRHLDAWERS
jgi:hypothetical protein